MKNLNKTFENEMQLNGVEKGFEKLAQYLMNECILNVNSNEYQLAEIEFYYCDKERHPDSFVHANEEQRTTNQFYFHGSGFDITFGNNDYYGGILIRSVISKDEIINGPVSVFNHFLHISNHAHRTFNFKMFLEEKKESDQNIIVTSSRVGLNIKPQDNNNEYIFKPYRYIIKNDEHILNLLKKNEPTFLAYFLKKQEKESENPLTFNNNVNRRLNHLCQNLNHNKEGFLNISRPKLRQLFVNLTNR